MITQIKKNLPIERKKEFLEKLLVEVGESKAAITVDYIGILSVSYPHKVDITVHNIITPLYNLYSDPNHLRYSMFVVILEPRVSHFNHNVFSSDVETVSQFVGGLFDTSPNYGNLHINGKKIEY